MWKKSFLFHEKRTQLNIIQNLFILVIGIILVYFGFSLSEGEISLFKALLLAVILVIGFDLSFVSFLIIVNISFKGDIKFSFNKLYVGLSGIIIPMFIILITKILVINNIINSDYNDEVLIICGLIVLVGSPLWIIFIILGIIENLRNKKTKLHIDKKRTDMDISSFLFSLVVFAVFLGFLTSEEINIKMDLQKSLLLSFFIAVISYFIVNKKLKTLEGNKVGFIGKTVFDRSFDGGVDDYSTYSKIAKEIKEDYNKSKKNYKV